MDINAKIAECKVVPVIKLDSVSDAAPLGEALINGGLPVAEITFRTEAAEGSIKEMAKRFPDMLVGAGTVTNIEQAKRAQGAGAKFIVLPGTSLPVVEFCVDQKIPVYPGVCTPTEVMALLQYNLEVLKFFPAEAYGGLSTIKALCGPFPALKFMPTGGIGPKNILDYLAFDKIVACGGSWMVKDSDIKAGNFAAIEQLTREAVELVKGA